MWFPGWQLSITLRTCQKCKLLGPALVFWIRSSASGPQKHSCNRSCRGFWCTLTSDHLFGRREALSMSVHLCVSVLWGRLWEGGEEGWPEGGGALWRRKVTEAEAAAWPPSPSLPTCCLSLTVRPQVHHVPRSSEWNGVRRVFNKSKDLLKIWANHSFSLYRWLEI